MPELEKMQFIMKERRRTKTKVLFDEELGEQEFSDVGTAVGVLYIRKEALSLITAQRPATIRVTIEPM